MAIQTPQGSSASSSLTRRMTCRRTARHLQSRRLRDGDHAVSIQVQHTQMRRSERLGPRRPFVSEDRARRQAVLRIADSLPVDATLSC